MTLREWLTHIVESAPDVDLDRDLAAGDEFAQFLVVCTDEKQAGSISFAPKSHLKISHDEFTKRMTFPASKAAWLRFQ